MTLSLFLRGVLTILCVEMSCAESLAFNWCVLLPSCLTSTVFVFNAANFLWVHSLPTTACYFKRDDACCADCSARRFVRRIVAFNYGVTVVAVCGAVLVAQITLLKCDDHFG